MRLLKVYESSGMLGRDIPKIQLQGKWLSDIGYSVGDYIKVESEGDRLIISKDNARKLIDEQIQSECDACYRKKHCRRV